MTLLKGWLKKMRNKFLSFLGIVKKAGKLFLGMDNVKNNILKKDITLILVTKDISQSSLEKIKKVAEEKNVKFFSVNYTMEDVYSIVGRRAAIMGISDENFVNKIISLISPE